MSLSSSTYPSLRQHITSLILPLEDVAVYVQEDMREFLRTAALEPAPGMPAVLNWLRRRNIHVTLLTYLPWADVELILQRLGWQRADSTGAEIFGTASVYDRLLPIVDETDFAALVAREEDTATCLVMSDRPTLLNAAKQADCGQVLGMLNGRSNYQQLIQARHDGLLESPLQLPNYLIDLVERERPAAVPLELPAWTVRQSRWGYGLRWG